MSFGDLRIADSPNTRRSQDVNRPSKNMFQIFREFNEFQSNGTFEFCNKIDVDGFGLFAYGRMRTSGRSAGEKAARSSSRCSFSIAMQPSVQLVRVRSCCARSRVP